MRSMTAKSERRAARRLASSSPLIRSLVTVGRSYGALPDLARFQAEFEQDWQPHAKQRELHDQIDTRYVAAVAGRRGGKTAWGGREFARRVMRDAEEFREQGGKWEAPTKITDKTAPSLHYWIVAPTYDLVAYPVREFFTAIGGEDSDLILKYVPSDNCVWLLGGIKIDFKSAEYPKRLVAAGLSGLWADEAARIKGATWDDNLSPTLVDNLGWALITSTPTGQNWLYQDVWLLTQHGVGDPEYYGLNFYTSDNTALPHLAEEMAKARKRLAPAVFRRNYMADFHAFVGKVFESFLDDTMHIVERIPRRAFVAAWGGADWGYTHAGSAICLGVTAAGDLYAWAEDYREKLVVTPPPEHPHADCWVNRFQRRQLSHWWADPSRPGYIQTCREAGIVMSGANNAIDPGLDLLTTLLQPVEWAPGLIRPSLRIHRSCTNLRRELVSYAYSDKTGKPIKENDHAVDGLRYGLYTEFRRGTSLGAKAAQLEGDFPSIFAAAA